MKKKILTLFAAAAVLAAPILVSSCGSKSKASANGDELEGRISLSGAFALYPLAVKWAEEFKKLHVYYTTRPTNPLKKMQSLIVIACKILRVIFTILRAGQKYDPVKLLNDIRHLEKTAVQAA